jgi:glycosyltransferase involved in cell wall biosynthesis
VIYNGVNKLYRPLSKQDKENVHLKHKLAKPYFLFVGSLHPRKNIHRLLQAFDLFAQSNADTDLVIVGAAMWSKQAFNFNPELINRIHFMGHLKTQTLAEIMASAEAFVYVPYFEGFGMPLAEAMACHTPIIAGNKSCLPEIAADAARYVDPYNVQEIANGMLQLKNDVALQSQLIKAGQQRVKDFSWDHAAEQIWQELQQLVS